MDEEVCKECKKKATSVKLFFLMFRKRSKRVSRPTITTASSPLKVYQTLFSMALSLKFALPCLPDKLACVPQRRTLCSCKRYRMHALFFFVFLPDSARPCCHKSSQVNRRSRNPSSNQRERDTSLLVERIFFFLLSCSIQPEVCFEMYETCCAALSHAPTLSYSCLLLLSRT